MIGGGMIRRPLDLAAWALLSATVLGQTRGPQAPADPLSPVVVLLSFADGLKKSLNTGPGRCGMWTTQFPRAESWTPPANQLPINALNFACERTPEGAKVAISVLRGSPHQKEDPVATVHVTAAAPVVVDQPLRAVGILPLTLSLTSTPRPGLAPPTVTIASPRVEWVDAAVVMTPRATYRVIFRNRGDKAVRGMAIEGRRAGQLATSGKRVGPEGTALIDAGGEFTLDSFVPLGRPAADGSVPMAPLDEIVVTAVLWADGSYEGGMAGLEMRVADHGNRVMLGRVLGELQRGSGSAAELRAALTGLPIDVSDSMVDECVSQLGLEPPVRRDRIQPLLRVTLQSIKTHALNELAAFERAPQAPGAFEKWVQQTTDRYRRWHERLRPSSPTL
jgi:hypothetical protein